MKITFHPFYDNSNLIEATEIYQDLWNSEGKEIVEAIERHTGLKFTENNINAIVFEGVSQSHPLAFRASYDEDTKKATLVHELLHVICAYRVEFPDETDSLPMSLHKIIFLVLYEIWSELYGEEFSKKEVEIESARTEMYKKTWEWALSMSDTERVKLFNKLKI